VNPRPAIVRVRADRRHRIRTVLTTASLAASLLLPLTAVGQKQPSAATAEPAARTPPNILVILSDDVGYSDIGCYGGEIATPNLDALAAGGVRFTQFYNTARCCPTRASLLTGLHPHQAGIGHMMEDRGHDGYRGRLNQRCITLAEALRPSGYRTYAVGKWHVTPGQTERALADTSNWPCQRGFDRFYGTIHGAGSYFDPSSLVRDNRLLTVANDPEYQPPEYYYTEAIGDHAVRFLREHARDHPHQPFFLYTAFTAAHWPLHARDADIARYRGRYDGGYEPIRAARLARMKSMGLIDPRWTLPPPAESWEKVKDKPFERRCMEVYAAQLDSMDQTIGRMLAELKASGRFANTLIFYLQDNGGCAEGMGRGQSTNAVARTRALQPTLPAMGPNEPQFDSVPKQTRDGWPVRQGLGVMPGGPDTYIAYGRGWANVSNTPFREYKHWTHEGGISTPLIVSWPAGIRPAPTSVAPTNNQNTPAISSATNRLVHQPAQLVDIMATCLDVAGVRYPRHFFGSPIHPLEGQSLRPWIAPAPDASPAAGSQPDVNSSARANATPRLLFWEHEGNRAVREGDWKLVARENQPWELYHLATDRTEMHNLVSSEPARVFALSNAWHQWAARSHVLPLGAWRRGNADANFNAATQFVLQSGQRLSRQHAPAIARRAFEITASFTADDATHGVLIAHGGNARGYSLYIADHQLHWLVREQGGSTTTSTPLPTPAGSHTAVARLSADGTLSLQLDQQPPTTNHAPTLLHAMPGDGLEVGADEGGAVGPYAAPNRFRGSIQSIRITLQPEPGSSQKE
jgi:arylsulfatase A-like enzyme